MARFYSVQSSADAARLAEGGSPWPGGLRRANLGFGFYAWLSREVASHYQTLLERHGGHDLRIVAYEIDDLALGQLRKLDLTEWDDDAVTTWLDRHSCYGEGRPHGYDYVVRPTHLGPEHYFTALASGLMQEVS